MKQAYLYHYYREHELPLRRISALSFDQARSVHNSFWASGFPDEDLNPYWSHRLEVEQWLRQACDSQGIERDVDAPYYFCYGPSDWCKGRYERTPNGPCRAFELVIAVDAVDATKAGFTLPDSYYSFLLGVKQPAPIFRENAKSYHGKVFRLKDVAEVLQEHKWEELRHQCKLDTYVEVQLWYNPLLG
jgi:hypothetical protein